MKLIYNNFDTLEVTFQGILPEAILKKLASAKEQAQEDKKPVLAEIGKNKLPVLVAESGMSGGYRYRFDTGFDGETWCAMHSTNSKNWGIRVLVKSAALALHGYEAIQQRLIQRLIDFEAIGQSRWLSGSQAVTNLPLERISRFDYCFDFIMESAFEPLAERFIAHPRLKKKTHGEKEVIPCLKGGSGDRNDTVTLGNTNNYQITVYNKTKEIVAHKKPYWWTLWGLDEQAFKETGQKIWRIEVRAGKGEIDKWPAKRFKDFESKAGDIIEALLKAVRYTNPLKDDLNRSRWPTHPLWQTVIEHSYKVLAPYRSKATREAVLKDFRENVKEEAEKRILGNYYSYAAVIGYNADELSSAHDDIGAVLNKTLQQDFKAVEKKHKRAEEKYRLLY